MTKLVPEERRHKHGRVHLIIPDTQVKPGVDITHLHHIGQYILEVKPEVIIHLGDHFDMPSLSSYDRGKKTFEGRRYNEDIAAGKKALEVLLDPIRKYNARAAFGHRTRYKPELHFLMGNHEERIQRVINDDPRLEGTIGYQDLELEKFGFKVHPFLRIVDIDGINYVHYIQANNSPRAVGTAKQISNIVHKSTIVGHQQTLDYVYIPSRLPGGAPVQCMIAGACYTHVEDYRGEQGQEHFRGIVRLSGVRDGNFAPMFIPLSYMQERYDNGKKYKV